MPGFFIVGFLSSHDSFGIMMGLGLLVLLIIFIIGCIKSRN